MDTDIGRVHIPSGPELLAFSNDVPLNGVSVGGGKNCYTLDDGNGRQVQGMLIGHPQMFVTRYRVTITAVQANTVLYTPAAGNSVGIVGVEVATANLNSGDLDLQIGFGSTTTPTALGCFFSHPGIYAGQYLMKNGNGCKGSANLKVLLTATPVGSSPNITFDCVITGFEFQ
jgi:hypothetical protein